jgi:hypothetical protein
VPKREAADTRAPHGFAEPERLRGCYLDERFAERDREAAFRLVPDDARFADDFFAVDVRFAVDFFLAPPVLRAVDFFAVERFAVDFLAVDFLALDLRLEEDFFAVDFRFAVDFLAVDFFLAPPVERAVVFLRAVVDFAAVFFFAADFFFVAAFFFDEAFFAVDFFRVEELRVDPERELEREPERDDDRVVAGTATARSLPPVSSTAEASADSSLYEPAFDVCDVSPVPLQSSWVM